MDERRLDLENVGRIGTMFIDGDLLRDVLIDPYTCDEDDVNYSIPAFNRLKAALSKIERMNPDSYVVGALWHWYPGNRRMAAPAVVGRAHPIGGFLTPDPPTTWVITDCSPELYESMSGGKVTQVRRSDGRRTLFFPIRASNGDVVGAMELTEGGKRGPYERNYTLSETV